MRKLILIISCVAVLASPAMAASLSSGDLPQGAHWYVHINIDLMRNTELGRHLLDESVGEAFADIEDEIGVRFAHRVQGVTVYGGSLPPDSGALVAHGVLGSEIQDELVAAMSKATTFFEAQHRGYLYYAVEDVHGNHGNVEDTSKARDEDLTYVAFGADQTLFSESLELVHAFIDNGGYLVGVDPVDPRTLIVLEADRALVAERWRRYRERFGYAAHAA